MARNQRATSTVSCPFHSHPATVPPPSPPPPPVKPASTAAQRVPPRASTAHRESILPVGTLRATRGECRRGAPYVHPTMPGPSNPHPALPPPTPPSSPGSYSVQENGEDILAECESCSAGTFSGEPGSSGCSYCPNGKVAATEGAASCTTCPAGTSSEQASGTDILVACESCAVGKASGEPGATNCDLCLSGTAAPAAGATSCTTCLAGTSSYQTVPASYILDECVPCVRGSYSGTAGSETCNGACGILD